MGALIDSSVIIALERGQLAPDAFKGVEDEPVILSTVTVSELLHGVFRADERRRVKREAFVDGLLAEAVVLAFDMRVARVHARISALLAAEGSPISAHDLLIGSTALAHDLKVLTANARDFTRIPGLDVITVR